MNKAGAQTSAAQDLSLVEFKTVKQAQNVS